MRQLISCTSTLTHTIRSHTTSPPFVNRRDHLDVLVRRTQIDLKDKWRNICRNKTDAEIEDMLLEVKLLNGVDGPTGMSQR